MIWVLMEDKHEFVLLTHVREQPPEGYASTLYILDSEESINVGNAMTCIVCGNSGIIVGKD